MSVSARRFPYEKSVILNVLYDALDAIDSSIDKADSICGTFLISFGNEGKDKFRITIFPSLMEEATLMEILPAGDGPENRELSAVLFDEMDAIIKRAGIGA